MHQQRCSVSGTTVEHMMLSAGFFAAGPLHRSLAAFSFVHQEDFIFLNGTLVINRTKII